MSQQRIEGQQPIVSIFLSSHIYPIRRHIPKWEEPKPFRCQTHGGVCMVHRIGNHSDHLAIHLQEVLEGGAVAGVAGVGQLHALRLARRACGGKTGLL